MKESGRLIMRTISSDPDFNADLDLGVVDLSPELATLVLERHRHVLDLRDHEGQLCHIAWWDPGCMFVSSPAALQDLDADWVLAPSGTGSDFVPKRTEVDEMRIDDTHVWWSCSPRHLDIVVATRPVPISVFQNWLREHERYAAPSGSSHPHPKENPHEPAAPAAARRSDGALPRTQERHRRRAVRPSRP